MDRSTAESLGATTYLVNPETLSRARAAGVAAATLDELGQRHAGKSFDGRRDFERALKSLNNRPRSVRALKRAARHFETSVLNRTFGQREDLLAALAASGVRLSDEDRERLVDASYTGWTWTTDNLRRMFGTADTAQVLANTLIYVFVTLILFNTGFALVLAITTFYLPTTEAAVFRGIWFLPRITPPVLYVLLWKWFAWGHRVSQHGARLVRGRLAQLDARHRVQRLGLRRPHQRIRRRLHGHDHLFQRHPRDPRTPVLGQRGRWRFALAAGEAHHPAATALADPVRDELPDAVAADLVRIHPARHRRRAGLDDRGLVARRLPHGAQQLRRKPAIRLRCGARAGAGDHRGGALDSSI